jgi:hypothetical protein
METLVAYLNTLERSGRRQPIRDGRKLLPLPQSLRRTQVPPNAHFLQIQLLLERMENGVMD